MDPDATLEELRQLVEDTLTLEERYTTPGQHRMAELFTALDEWMSRRGFPPAAWGEV